VKFNICAFFENLSRKFKLDCNTKRITGILHKDIRKFMVANISLSSSYSDIFFKIVKEIKIHILSSVAFFLRIARL